MGHCSLPTAAIPGPLAPWVPLSSLCLDCSVLCSVPLGPSQFLVTEPRITYSLCPKFPVSVLILHNPQCQCVFLKPFLLS